MTHRYLCSGESFEIREHLREFKAKFKTILDNLSGPLVLLFYEKKTEMKNLMTLSL